MRVSASRSSALATGVYERTPVFLEHLWHLALPLGMTCADYKLPLTVLRGPSVLSGCGVTVLTAGMPPGRDRLARSAFCQQPRVESLGTIPLWSLAARVRDLGPSCDLAIARVTSFASRVLFGPDWLVVPEFPSLVMDVPDDLSKLETGSHSLREDLRVIRREGLEAQLSFDVEDCEQFHDRMHLPLVRQRHGEAGYVHAKSRLRRMVRKGGGIVWISRGGVRVAGCVFRRMPDRLKFIAVGVVDCNQDLLKAGVLTAAYQHGIHYAHDLGYRLVDFGGGLPLLNDGLFRFKQKWGCSFRGVNASHYVYLLRWSGSTNRLPEILAAMPLLTQHDGEVITVTGWPSDRACSSAWLAELRRSMRRARVDRAVILTDQTTQGTRSMQSLLRAVGNSTDDDLPIDIRDAAQFLSR